MPEDLADVRLRICLACEHYIRRGTWNWYRCAAKDLDSHGEPTTDLDSAYRRGPDGNCPLGLWKGAVVKTDQELAAEASVKLAEKANYHVDIWTPVFVKVPSQADLFEALDTIEARGSLSSNMVAEIKKVVEKG